jgi:hypothetical protein
MEDFKAVAFLLIFVPFNVKTPPRQDLWQLFIRLLKKKVPKKGARTTKSFFWPSLQ